MLGQILLLLATFAVFHAAYSTYETLSHLKALGKPESIPQDIALEALIGLVLGIIGASLKAPPLKEITWVSEMKTRSVDEMNTRTGFAAFGSRLSHLNTTQDR